MTERICCYCKQVIPDDKVGYRKDIFVGNKTGVAFLYCSLKCSTNDHSKRASKRAPHYKDKAPL